MPLLNSGSSAPVDQKERLTVTQLASYDDVLTDALVDRVGVPVLRLRSYEEISNTVL